MCVGCSQWETVNKEVKWAFANTRHIILQHLQQYTSTSHKFQIFLADDMIIVAMIIASSQKHLINYFLSVHYSSPVCINIYNQ